MSETFPIRLERYWVLCIEECDNLMSVLLYAILKLQHLARSLEDKYANGKSITIRVKAGKIKCII